MIFGFKRAVCVLAMSLFAGSARGEDPLMVFAAASLTEPFTELGALYESRVPGATVTFVFAGAQRLSMQLNDGAQADVFASANRKEMDAVRAGGLAADSDVRLFAANELIAIVPADNPGQVQSLEELARPGLKVVLAAEDVPVGAYTRESLAKMESRFGKGFQGRVLANVASNEESVKQVLAKVRLGEADAGVVYRTDQVGLTDIESIPIPSEFNVRALYPVAVLKAAPQRDQAQAFVDLLFAAEGRAILQKWGFLAAQP
ncbi:MAG TPA: molybdate ABC transporter substrate-binding protein [Verrucomicrobia bacterium]|nr:MAG: molybdate ABC transporter substrate-binding protein [Lentisphaerae bacterium GWF2_57_35]HBA85121.1 molybdate ABC transporter substrate-binding protein [Verrucomicrobiota bacterium]